MVWATFQQQQQQQQCLLCSWHKSVKTLKGNNCEKKRELSQSEIAKANRAEWLSCLPYLIARRFYARRLSRHILLPEPAFLGYCLSLEIFLSWAISQLLRPLSARLRSYQCWLLIRQSAPLGHLRLYVSKVLRSIVSTSLECFGFRERQFSSLCCMVLVSPCFVLVRVFRNPTPCFCLTSLPLKKNLWPSWVDISPKFFRRISQRPKMFQRYLLIWYDNSSNLPAIRKVVTFQVPIMISLARILLVVTPVAYFSPPILRSIPQFE